jgi:rhodanese-related sulfurtransferase
MTIELTVGQAKQNWNQYQFLDVREPHEYTEYNLGIPNIPLSRLAEDAIELTQYDKTKPLLVVCAHGVRSQRATAFLENAGFTKVYSLQGGLAKWQASEVS